MQRLDDGSLVYSASDLVGFLECEHLTTLERAAAANLVARPERHDPELEILQERGLEHEQRYLASLRLTGRQVVEGRHPEASVAQLSRRDRLAADAELTLQHMRAGADVIYQAAFFDGSWLGYADFLLRTEGASGLGTWHYEVADTKLARRTKGSALLQLCVYSDLLSRLQDRLPEMVHVALGGSAQSVDSHRLDDYMAYYRSVRARFDAAVAAGAPLAFPLRTTPPPVGHCGVCRWNAHCTGLRQAADHLSQVAFLRSDQAKTLEAAGIPTLTALATLSQPLAEVPKLSAIALETLHRQAALQLTSPAPPGVPRYELRDAEPNRGLAALPEPSRGDLFFDMEGDPWAEGDGLEYLFGVWDPMQLDASGQPTFRAWWAHSRSEEKQAFEQFIDFVMTRWADDPEMHVYHYAAYEPGRMGMLSTRHRTREVEVDRLLRGERFVDLYRVVRQGVRVGTSSYSIKRLEPLYALGRGPGLAEAMSSVVTYERYVRSVSAGHPEPALLEELYAYNRDDCRSNAELRAWLEARREEAAAARGVALPRPSTAEPGEDKEPDRAAAALAARLLDGVPLYPEARAEDPELQGRWLLANLLEWHRREEKVEWWIYYDRCRRSAEELVADEEAIGQLTWLGEVERPKQSVRHRYAFDPEQPYRMRVGDSAHDPAEQAYCGRIMAIDALRGTVDLQWAATRIQPHPRALIPEGPYASTPQKAALLRIGTWVLEHGLRGPGPYRAARELLLGTAPHIGQAPGAPLVASDEPAVEAACRAVLRLEQTVLPIQGPPGAGKTWTGAEMILRLIADGRRVGIVAFTHKALTNLLDEVIEHAAGRPIRAIRKLESGEKPDPALRYATATANRDVADALRMGTQLAAGTGWLWASDEMEGSVDTLFVDEAGQFALANVVAVSTAARQLVLLGDPQQLSQVKKGSHPDGVDVSGLEYILDGRAVMPAERGIFLPTTFRLHRGVSGFTSEVFYAGQLCSASSADQQAIDARGALTGTGIRWVGVDHQGNHNSSAEEAEVIVELYGDLLAGDWVLADGTRRPLSPSQLLVVAPYNAQVELLTERLRPIAATAPAGAGEPWVGTVDKVQGQEAVAVIYSTATSSEDELPRSMEFLYSLNRLNVATSRGRCLAAIVGSPRLLQVRVHTPQQMRLANAFCRFVELASGEAERIGRPARTVCE